MERNTYSQNGTEHLENMEHATWLIQLHNYPSHAIQKYL